MLTVFYRLQLSLPAGFLLAVLWFPLLLFLSLGLFSLLDFRFSSYSCDAPRGYNWKRT